MGVCGSSHLVVAEVVATIEALPKLAHLVPLDSYAAVKGHRTTLRWKDNEKQGSGTLIYADKSTYEGNWERGLQEGFGKLTTKDGVVLEGEWKNGKIDGIGKLVQSNGDRYEGY